MPIFSRNYYDLKTFFLLECGEKIMPEINLSTWIHITTFYRYRDRDERQYNEFLPFKFSHHIHVRHKSTSIELLVNIVFRSLIIFFMVILQSATRWTSTPFTRNQLPRHDY